MVPITCAESQDKHKHLSLLTQQPWAYNKDLFIVCLSFQPNMISSRPTWQAGVTK